MYNKTPSRKAYRKFIREQGPLKRPVKPDLEIAPVSAVEATSALPPRKQSAWLLSGTFSARVRRFALEVVLGVYPFSGEYSGRSGISLGRQIHVRLNFAAKKF